MKTIYFLFLWAFCFLFILIPEELSAKRYPFVIWEQPDGYLDTMTIGEVEVYMPDIKLQNIDYSLYDTLEAYHKDFEEWKIYRDSFKAMKEYWEFKLYVLPEIDKYLIRKVYSNAMSISDAQNEMRIAIVKFKIEIQKKELDMKLNVLKGIVYEFYASDFSEEVSKYVNEIEKRIEEKSKEKIEKTIVKMKPKSKKKK